MDNIKIICCRIATRLLFLLVLWGGYTSLSTAQTETEDHSAAKLTKIEKLLEQTKAELLAEREKTKQLQQALVKMKEQQQITTGQKAPLATDNNQSKKIQFNVADGTLDVGGAIRANYAVGDYSKTGAASRATEDGGNVSLDIFRINLDYQSESFSGKFDYRFSDGYHFLHTAWVGYTYEDKSQVQVGLNRVPFGAGAYGVSKNWFFDQNYYVGLADDMDVGIKYSKTVNKWTVDMAYYLADEGNYAGASRDSSRYSYDVVNESGTGYEEKNQFNIRGIYTLDGLNKTTDVGFSLQHGELESQGRHDDGSQFAGSVHMSNRWKNITLDSQLTYYKYSIDENQPLGTDKLVQLGAYDFPITVASEAWIPAISLSYRIDVPSIAWLDYLTPYIEYSSVLKEEANFNDSELFVIGSAWASGGWYLYTDLAYSNGNEFVGGETEFGDRLGRNADDEWQTRLNFNIGYYY